MAGAGAAMMNRFRKWLYKPKVSGSSCGPCPGVALSPLQFLYPEGPSLIRQTSFPWPCMNLFLRLMRWPFRAFRDLDRPCTCRALTVLFQYQTGLFLPCVYCRVSPRLGTRWAPDRTQRSQPACSDPLLLLVPSCLIANALSSFRTTIILA